MLNKRNDIASEWARLGVQFACAPSGTTPDVERLLLDTACEVESNARLLPLVVTWIVHYGAFIARHRLKRLVETDLDVAFQPALGLLLEEAVQHGASRDLLIVSEVCTRRRPASPLFAVQQGDPALVDLAMRHASPRSKRWGCLAPAVELKEDAIRPVSWILDHNPGLRDRIVRKGDLRASLLETLRRDLPGRCASSESALTRWSGATRTAVRKAIRSLELEGEVVIGDQRANDRDLPIRLRRS